MKFLLLVLALVMTSAVCNGAHFEVLPPNSARCVTEQFANQLEAVKQRNWYSSSDQRENVADVYQLGPLKSEMSNLFANIGWGLHRGKMTQYKFSFIGESRNCIIGFTHPEHFAENYRASGPGLNPSNGGLIGDGLLKSNYVNEVGRDSDVVDWFIEYHQDGHVEVYMTLNGEPLGMAFRMSQSIIQFDEFAVNMRPLLRWSSDTIDSNKGIAVIQYSPVEFQSVRPYASQRKPDGENFELRNPGAILPEEISQNIVGNKFDENYAVRIAVKETIISIDVSNIILCPVVFHPDGVLGPKEKQCGRTLMYTHEPYRSLEIYLSQFLENSDRYERLPSGDFALHSDKFGTLVFTPRVHFEPVVDSPFQ